MKKAYIKPVVYMEKFDLSQSIAAGCGAVAGGSSLGKPAHWSKETCGWNLGNMILWAESTGNCTDIIEIDEPVENIGICYNNPSGGSSIFSS